jgi:hypothetical protein
MNYQQSLIQFATGALLAAVMIVCMAPVSTASAQGTAFTYQGQLNDSGQPANGVYDLRFSLFTTNTGGSLAYGFVTNSGTVVSNGLFTVTLDFGTGVFNGTPYWLQIGVRTNGAAGFTAISPRQQLTPTPYSIFAENVNADGISGTIPAGNLGGTYGNAVNFNNGANSFDGSFYGAFYGSSFIGGTFVGSFVGNGSGLTDVWQTGGNLGTTAGANFVGTTDNQPLEIHVNNLRALRLEPTTDTNYVTGAINLIGGSAANLAAPGVHGATIAGGGASFYFGGNVENTVASDYGTIGGGVNNGIGTNAYESTIAGGNANWIYPGAFRSTISGGWANLIATNANHSSIGGGYHNLVQPGVTYAAIGGGLLNTNGAFASTIGGGQQNNTGGGDGSVIGGGYYNANSGSAATISGGQNNMIGGAADHAFIGGGGGNMIVGSELLPVFSTIAGGEDNLIQTNTPFAVIGGGTNNIIQSGAANTVITGGGQNSVGTNAISSFIGGGQFNSIQFSSSYATIGGGTANVIQTNNNASTIGGGVDNQIQSVTFAGLNAANTIAGGNFNAIQTNSLDSTIAGGYFNQISAEFASIGGGGFNTNDAFYGTIPGGTGNFAAGNYSFAAGYHAQALYQGDFVWADSQNTNFAATATDQVSFRCQGGVRFTSGSAAANQTVAWTPGTGSWSFTSDRNAKENFKAVDVHAILEKVAQLPLTEWNYKGYIDRHIGPMAQDFHAAFPFNSNDKMLNSADEAGVELAAIQGLNEKLEAGDQKSESRLQKLETENVDLKLKNDSLEKRLAALEQIISKQKSN